MAHSQLPLDDTHAAWLQQDDGFRQLVLEHHELDERIRQLSTITYLSDAQQFEELSLKKRKLALKDRMAALTRSRATAGSSA